MTAAEIDVPDLIQSALGVRMARRALQALFDADVAHADARRQAAWTELKMAETALSEVIHR